MNCQQTPDSYQYIYGCIMNIQVPHEVENQRALAKMTSEIMKNGHDMIIHMGCGTWMLKKG